MEFEKYIIEVGVRSIKYLSETATGYKLTDELKNALQLNTENNANAYINNSFPIPCLKDKQTRIRKLICKLEEELI